MHRGKWNRMGHFVALKKRSVACIEFFSVHTVQICTICVTRFLDLTEFKKMGD